MNMLDKTEEGRRRAIIENVAPEIDCGRYPIKRVMGEKVVVEADIFADGHDALSARLKFRHGRSTDWSEVAMEPLVNDRWHGQFVVAELGEYCYTIEAWVDPFRSWRNDLQKRIDAGQDVSIELLAGAQLVEEAARRATGDAADRLKAWVREFSTGDKATLPQRTQRALDERLAALTVQHADRRFATQYGRELRVVVDPMLARFGAWYEMFPRSCAKEAGRHGTFRDVEDQLPRIARMGFDVLYFPPIHPIGRTFRKGKNNNPVSQPGEPGSPWGIGAAEGGHKAIHPELGTLKDFRRLVRKARELRIEIALDIAFQCSVDHPYVKEHPEWFKKRPDGSIQYAENPPKKYEDIYPLDFECADWRGLWQELKSIIDFWIGEGVRVFRVDNPHTKPLQFWEWLIDAVKREHPEVIFLAEAFTRPKLMYGLAKRGFTQSYSYFAWRNTQWELAEYFEELTRPPVKEFFRPNLWPNTPDILTQYLQSGGRPGFAVRFILAATLGASYGIYGPAFELCVSQPRETGSEEYFDSEKYEIKSWDLNQAAGFADLIARVNRIRRENAALQSNDRLIFHATDNDQLLAYSKTDEGGNNTLLVVVNLDAHHVQSGWLDLALNELDLTPDSSFQVHDLLTGERYPWHGARNYVKLDPSFIPAAIFRLRRRQRTERDFDYFD